MDDLELLREYVKQGSEKAFATLVSRHVDLVYAAAFRRVRDQHLAEEVTRTAFIILARKAPQIGEKTVLAAWLYRTARYVASDALKSEYRRQQRERQALALESSAPEAESLWNSVAPRLDDALGRLSDKDRTAILLRFFENKTLREVGRSLGVDEEAARKRVARGVAKLRLHLSKGELALTGVALAGVLASNAVPVAPTGLAVSVTAAALAEGAGMSASTLAVIKAAMKSMLSSKTKTILAVRAASLVVAAFIIHQSIPLPQSDEIAARHLAASRANKLRVDSRPESVGTDCMRCHHGNMDKTVLLRGLTAKGIWKEPTQGSEGDFEICNAGANRLIEIIHDRFGESVRGWDGSCGWCQSPRSGLKLLSVGEVEELRRDVAFLAWPEDERWMRAVRTAKFAEKRCYCVDLIDNAGQHGARFFDINTGLQVGTTWSATSAGSFAAIRVLSNYRDFDGILMPATLARVEPGRRQIFDVTSVVVADIAESHFAPPEQVLELFRSAPADNGLRVN